MLTSDILTFQGFDLVKSLRHRPALHFRAVLGRLFGIGLWLKSTGRRPLLSFGVHPDLSGLPVGDFTPRIYTTGKKRALTSMPPSGQNSRVHTQGQAARSRPDPTPSLPRAVIIDARWPPPQAD